MTTLIDQSVHNPYSNGLTNGTIPGDAATGHLIRYISAEVDALEPYNTPFYSRLKTGKSFNQLKLEWLQKHQRPHRTAFDGSGVNNSATTFGVTAGSGANITTNDVLYVTDPVNGDEIMWVESADGTDTLATVRRAQGGTSAVLHPALAVIEIIGSAETLTGVDHAISPVVFGDWLYNYPQRFAKALELDRTRRHTPDREYSGDVLTTLIMEEAKNQKLQLEKAIIRGGRQAGTPASGAKRPPMMGGIKSFLGTTTANVVNLSGQTFGIYDIENLTSTVWSTAGDNVARHICMSMNTKRAFNRLVNPLREATTTDNELRLTLDKVELETGVFDVEVVRYMPDGEIWGLDFSEMFVRPYEGQDWHVEDDSQSGRGDYDIYSVSGTFTLEMRREPAMWRIYGCDTTLANYPYFGTN